MTKRIISSGIAHFEGRTEAEVLHHMENFLDRNPYATERSRKTFPTYNKETGAKWGGTMEWTRTLDLTRRLP